MYAVQPRDRGVRHVVAAPRGSGKTTTHTLCILHHIVYLQWYEALGLQPNDFIIVIGEKKGGYDICTNVRGQLEGNPRLRKFFGDFVGVTWGYEKMQTRTGTFLIPASRESRIRGYNMEFIRPNLVIISDVQKGRDVDSSLIRDKDLIWFRDDVSKLGAGDDDETRDVMNMLVEGTTLHEGAIVPWCLKNPAYTGGRYPAVTTFADRDDLWGVWRSKFTDLTNPNREEHARQFYLDNRSEMLRGVDLLWPEGLSYYRCQVIRVTEGEASFNREMQQNPENPEKLLFNMKAAMKFVVEKAGLLKDDGVLVKWSEINGVSCFLDWAGGKDTKQNCFAAVVVVAWQSFPHTKEMYAYVLDAWVERKPPLAQIQQCFDYFAKYSKMTFRLGIEASGVNEKIDKQLHDAFIAEREKRKADGKPYDVRPQAVYQSQEKFQRISKMEPKISNGWVCFNRWLPAEFMDQMRLFPTHEFVDAPDALEGALQLLVTKKKEDIPRHKERKPFRRDF